MNTPTYQQRDEDQRIEIAELKQKVAMLETKLKRSENQFHEFCEQMSVIVSDKIDPSVKVPWMRCSPDLPKYVQGLESQCEHLSKDLEIHETAYQTSFRVVQQERDQLRVQLEAWQSVFGTTQLTHAIAALESANKAATELRSKLRNAGSKVRHLQSQGFTSQCIDAELEKDPQTNCGKDYFHRNEIIPLVDALDRIESMCNTPKDPDKIADIFEVAKHALAHAKNLLPPTSSPTL